MVNETGRVEVRVVAAPTVPLSDRARQRADRWGVVAHRLPRRAGYRNEWLASSRCPATPATHAGSRTGAEPTRREPASVRARAVSVPLLDHDPDLGRVLPAG